MTLDDFDPLYNTAEVAALMNVVGKTVRRWITSGQLPAARFGRSYLVKHSDLQKFIADRFNLGEEAEAG